MTVYSVEVLTPAAWVGHSLVCSADSAAEAVAELVDILRSEGMPEGASPTFTVHALTTIYDKET